jgi:hypothetical protein
MAHMLVHSKMLHPLTGEPLHALGVLPSGKVVWPTMGAAPDPPAGGDPAGGDGGGGTGTPPAGGDGGGKAPEPAFPANTPVEQMTAPQREAYYKAQTQKWKGRAENNYSLLNSLGVASAEEAVALKDKASRHDALEHELLSDIDKATDDAAKKTKAETEGKFRPMIVKSYFEGWAAARNVESDKLAAILEPLDLSKFLTSSGNVNTEKASAYLAGLQPAKGNDLAGPTVFGLGNHSAPPSTPGEQGRAQLDRRFPGRKQPSK